MPTVAAIINFQSPLFVIEQVLRIERHLKPDHIVVFDNSRNDDYCADIKEQATVVGAEYIRLDLYEGDSSRHHSMALNAAYSKLKDSYEIVALMDHDVFPFKDSDIFEVAKGFVFCGLKQVKDEKEYFHPGTLFLNTHKLISSHIDFSPIPGMDTGGQLWEIIKFLQHNEILAFPHQFEPELGYEIVNDCMMHFVKGSNWQKTDEIKHRERLAELFKRLKEL